MNRDKTILKKKMAEQESKFEKLRRKLDSLQQ
jgi:hypothetical protein